MNVIESYHTTGLCGTCYRELPAQIEFRDNGAAYIVKTCPVHGYQEAMVERDAEFWRSATQTNPNNATWEVYNKVSLVEVTDRCNVQCKHCYHAPDNAVEDLPAEFIINKALSMPTEIVCLMGAEPTMREDLPYIIKEITQRKGTIPKRVDIYTNGVKLKNLDYVKELAGSGINAISMSIHNSEYHKPAIWRNVCTALDNIISAGVQFGQVSFTVENKDHVNEAVDKMLYMKSRGIRPNNFCIRSPAEIGIAFEQDKEIFASEIWQWLVEVAAERGVQFAKHPNFGSNPYHVGATFDELPLQVIHWATVNSVDTSYMYMGPWASFIPNTRSTMLIQAILRDGMKKGWWQGRRLFAESTVQLVK